MFYEYDTGIIVIESILIENYLSDYISVYRYIYIYNGSKPFPMEGQRISPISAMIRSMGLHCGPEANRERLHSCYGEEKPDNMDNSKC